VSAVRPVSRMRMRWCATTAIYRAVPDDSELSRSAWWVSFFPCLRCRSVGLHEAGGLPGDHALHVHWEKYDSGLVWRLGILLGTQPCVAAAPRRLERSVRFTRRATPPRDGLGTFFTLPISMMMMMLMNDDGDDDGDDDGLWIGTSHPIAEFHANSSPWTAIPCSHILSDVRNPAQPHHA
jgi:hypothetical protein